jgi:manganese/zinc/iron transport system ATP- binding protein
VALEGLTHDVRVGARVALIGPNGSGKSTLIKAIGALLPVARGELRVFGWPAGTCRHRVAYLPQRPSIDWRFPVSLRQLVIAGRYVHLGWMRRPGARDLEHVDRALNDLGLYHVRDRQIGELSGGQQQRALLARALVQGADLLLLDEPLNHVDAATSDEVNAVLDRLRGEGKTVIVSTHDPDEFPTGFDDMICLKDGRPVPVLGRSFNELREEVWTG